MYLICKKYVLANRTFVLCCLMDALYTKIDEEYIKYILKINMEDIQNREDNSCCLV